MSRALRAPLDPNVACACGFCAKYTHGHASGSLCLSILTSHTPDSPYLYVQYLHGQTYSPQSRLCLWLTRRGSEAPAVLHSRWISTLRNVGVRRGNQASEGWQDDVSSRARTGWSTSRLLRSMAHGTHAPTQEAGRAQRCGRTPLQSVQGSIATYWRHWALTKSTVKGCRSRDRRHKILTRSRLGRELAHRTEAANGGAGACVARAAARCYEGRQSPVVFQVRDRGALLK